ncbi:hypothetical protein IMSAG013_00926 [Clostridiales bacterium]|nr:hypothetical protein IMSAG013_00926 [Clostridiales bacterium]
MFVCTPSGSLPVTGNCVIYKITILIIVFVPVVGAIVEITGNAVLIQLPEQHFCLQSRVFNQVICVGVALVISCAVCPQICSVAFFLFGNYIRIGSIVVIAVNLFPIEILLPFQNHSGNGAAQIPDYLCTCSVISNCIQFLGGSERIKLRTQYIGTICVKHFLRAVTDACCVCVVQRRIVVIVGIWMVFVVRNDCSCIVPIFS